MSHVHSRRRVFRPLLVAVVLTAAACGGGGGGGSTPTAPTAPTTPAPAAASVDFSGTWTGGATDSTGPGTMKWQLGQSGTALSGTATVTDTTQGVTGSGSFTGSVSGSNFQFTVTFAAGSFSGAATSCSATITGSGQSVSATTLSATYSGNNSCSGSIGSGQLTLSKP